MKIDKKKLIIGSIILSIIIILSLFFIFKDPNQLSSKEKKWIKDNKNVLLDIRIPTDINTFGRDGKGVFFDYINDFKDKYKLDINIVPYSYGSVTPGVSLKVDTNISPNDVLFYEDHYVLVGKDEKIVNNISELASKKIGVINTDLSYISYYLTGINATFEQFSNFPNLIGALSNLDYVIVPLNLTLDLVLENNYNIAYHFGDIRHYYYLTIEKNDTLLSIMNKYYNVWSIENFEDSYYNNLMNTFVRGLKLQDADIHSLTSKEYRYGLVEMAPYEILSGSNHGGVSGNYLDGFTKMTGMDIKYSKYSSYDNLNKVANNSRIDFYLGYVNLANKFTTLNSGMKMNYNIVSNESNKSVINSIYSLYGKTIYVLNNSILMSYLQSLNIATIKTYDNPNEIFTLLKKDNLVAVDSLFYNYYNNTKLKNIINKYSNQVMGSELVFKSNLDSTFNRLFVSYLRFIDGNLNRQLGVSNYNYVLRTGTNFTEIILTTIYVLVGLAFVGYLYYKYKNKIRISTKINKDTKMKYYDFLTNLKNRNYLNENIEKWNMNTLYPQIVIIIDLNNIKYINDTYGHEEGDKQIKAAANILFKTQPENSEIIRTDGNEFLIYLVGHNDKQVSTYIHKLYKEFKTMPYEFGAALGYSVRDNDLKLLEDIINEATLDMRTNKQNGVKDVE